MGCGCNKAKTLNANGAQPTFQVLFADGQKRNYLSVGEANAVIEASKNTNNPGTLVK